MEEQELEDLQNPENWDFENAEVRPPVKNPRAVVSVAFPRSDLDAVAKHAEQLGMRTSEFIRAAALEKVDRPSVQMHFVGVSLSGGVVLEGSHLAPTTGSARIMIGQEPVILNRNNLLTCRVESID